MLAKSFSELSHYFAKIRRVIRGHSFGAQFADSIFQTTRVHQYRMSQAIGILQESHTGSLCSIQYSM